MSERSEKKVVGREEWLKHLTSLDKKLYAMYSSVTDCITTDQSLMVVPVDDHMVHRGDGVFESFKCVNGNIYNLGDHLERLERSCSALGLELPCSIQDMYAIIVQTVRVSGQYNSLIRLLVSRGQGTMGVNPYACFNPELYIVVYELSSSNIDCMSEGVSVAISKIPVKPGIFAQVKTCNYLPNVLMKKEAIDLGVDFTISLDENGNLGEGATENIGIVTRNRELLMPPPERVLAGTTAKRAMVFAQQLVEEDLLFRADFRPISLEEVYDASEVHIYGTTLNVTPAVIFEGQPVGDGIPGPIATRLFEMLHQEMVPDSSRLIQVFE
ncbi:MAG TPA: aminotransferase class IV [Pontiella sp.]